MWADASVVSAFHKLLVRQLLRDFPIRSPATLPTKDFGEQLSRNGSCSISRGSFEREQCQDHHVYWRPAKLPFSSTRSFLVAPVLNFIFLCKVKNKAEETWFFYTLWKLNCKGNDKIQETWAHHDQSNDGTFLGRIWLGLLMFHVFVQGKVLWMCCI